MADEWILYWSDKCLTISIWRKKNGRKSKCQCPDIYKCGIVPGCCCGILFRVFYFFFFVWFDLPGLV